MCGFQYIWRVIWPPSDAKLWWSIGRTNCLHYSTRVDLYCHQILLLLSQPLRMMMASCFCTRPSADPMLNYTSIQLCMLLVINELRTPDDDISFNCNDTIAIYFSFITNYMGDFNGDFNRGVTIHRYIDISYRECQRYAYRIIGACIDTHDISSSGRNQAIKCP